MIDWFKINENIGYVSWYYSQTVAYIYKFSKIWLLVQIVFLLSTVKADNFFSSQTLINNKVHTSTQIKYFPVILMHIEQTFICIIDIKIISTKFMNHLRYWRPFRTLQIFISLSYIETKKQNGVWSSIFNLM